MFEKWLERRRINKEIKRQKKIDEANGVIHRFIAQFDGRKYVDDKFRPIHNRGCKVISLRGLIRYKPFKYVMSFLIFWNIIWFILWIMGV